HRQSRWPRLRLFALGGGTLLAGCALIVLTGAPGRLHASGQSPTLGKASAAAPVPQVVHDVKVGRDKLGSQIPGGTDPIQDYIQPDTQIEPSIAVNPANPKNAVAVYQEGRIADGGDATNGFATTFDGGSTWT